METKDYSIDAFNKFLDYVIDKGLMKPETAKSRKRAANAVLGILEPEDRADLRKIDLDHVSHRFANLQGSSFKPTSLKMYASRTNAALSDFIQYVEDPMGFKPSLSPRSRKSSENGKNEGKKVEKTTGNSQSGAGGGQSVHRNEHTETHSHLVFPIPIREGVIVKVSNIPADLSATEAEKIAAVVKALAVVSTE